MELFKWNQEFSVRSEVLDDQHKRLFDIVNNLYTAFMEKAHKEKLGDIIKELHKYTIYHFTEEEKLLDGKGTPLSAEHKKAHDEFISRIRSFNEKFEGGNSGVTYEIMNFLRQWLIQHIKGVDKGYSGVF